MEELGRNIRMNGHVGVRRDGRTMKSDFPPTPFRSGERENASSVRKYGKTRGAFNYASPAAPLPKKGDVVKTGRTVTASLLLFGSLMFCKNESVRSVRERGGRADEDIRMNSAGHGVMCVLAAVRSTDRRYFNCRTAHRECKFQPPPNSRPHRWGRDTRWTDGADHEMPLLAGSPALLDF